MGRIVHKIRAFALAAGAPGLFLVAFLDSSVLSLPEITDLLVIWMVTHHKARFVLYAASFVTWLLALRRFETVVIFPAFVGVNYVGVVLGGRFFLGESLSGLRLAGIVVILAGVVLVSR